eukprot:13334069-Heterocapsa_arctica.AAC.1
MASRWDPMPRMYGFACSAGPSDTPGSRVLVHRQSHKAAYFPMLGSLGEERLDRDVVITLFTIDEGPEGHVSPGCRNLCFQSSHPGGRVRPPSCPHSPSRNMAVVSKPFLEDVGPSCRPESIDKGQ